MLIGLTGGIASGKSTVLDLLSHMGAITIDADQVSRALTQKGSPTLEKIKETFGAEYFLPSGELDRLRLGEKIFSDPKAKKKLEDIMHPMINSRIQELVQMNREAYPDKNIVVDVPLLFEQNREKQYDQIWVVWVDFHTQLTRLMKRNSLSKKEAVKRISAQMPMEEKIKKADVVIDNSGGFDQTKAQVKQFYKRVLKMK